MADRSILTTDTLETFRTTYNSTAGDVGDITSLLNATGTIASSTDIVEAVVAMNTEIAALKAGTSIFETKIVFEGATDDAHETTLQVADPTADRTITLPNLSGTVSTIDGTETFTNKTLTAPVITSGVFNTAISGTAFLDEDNMASDSATKLASQQSIKAYVDAVIAAQDLDIAPDSGTEQQIILPSETLTFSGGTEIGTSASSNTVTFATTSNVVTKTGTQTLTNKTFTSPTIDSFTLGTSTISGLGIGANGIIIEGATADAHEVTLNAQDPTQDNVITIPNADMTAITTAQFATKGSHFAKVLALG